MRPYLRWFVMKKLRGWYKQCETWKGRGTTSSTTHGPFSTMSPSPTNLRNLPLRRRMPNAIMVHILPPPPRLQTNLVIQSSYRRNTGRSLPGSMATYFTNPRDFLLNKTSNTATRSLTTKCVAGTPDSFTSTQRWQILATTGVLNPMSISSAMWTTTSSPTCKTIIRLMASPSTYTTPRSRFQPCGRRQ